MLTFCKEYYILFYYIILYYYILYTPSIRYSNIIVQRAVVIFTEYFTVA